MQPMACVGAGSISDSGLTELARKGLWLGVGIAIVCGLAWNFTPPAAPLLRLETIPISGANFQGWNLPLTEREKKVLGQVDVLHRGYRIGGREFVLTIIDGNRNRHAVHDPRYCFQGAGWWIVNERRIAMQGGEAPGLKIARQNDQAETIFWFANGESRHSSFPRYWAQTTLRRMTLGHWGAAPPLVILQVPGGGTSTWEQPAMELIAALSL
jgi:hypothetical protein